MMQPTNKLRWVNRKLKNLPPAFNAFSPDAFETVLQQWWEGTSIEDQRKGIPWGEWRDIEVANETD